MLSTSVTSNPAESERSIEVEVNFNSPLHGVIIFLITTLGVYLQFQYQSLEKPLLEEHKTIMMAIYVNLFMYGMGLMAEIKLKTCCGSRCLSIIKRITPLFGILIVVLIMIILYPVLGFVAFMIWTLITLEIVIKLFQEILQWLYSIFIHGREIVIAYFNTTENSSPEIQENGSTDLDANDFSRENELLV